MSLIALVRAKEWQKSGVIFIHIPKNGGTSINKAIYGRFMGHYSINDVYRVRPDLASSLPSLAVTRNPWSRLYSAYRFCCKGHQMRDGAAISSANRYQVPVFATFERFVHEWLAGRCLEREDHVFHPQTKFIVRSQGALGVTHVGRLEDPRTYLEWLEDKLRRRITIDRLNRSSNALDYRNAYTDTMRDVVAQVYASDIAKWRYDF